MPQKLRRSSRTKTSGATSSCDKAAKGEKARYERRRRRRWGIIKKAKEYSTLFNEEVYLLIKDGEKAQYFSTAEGWISSPDQLGAVRVHAPNTCGAIRRQKSTKLDESSDSDFESIIQDVDSSHELMTPEPQRYRTSGCHPAEITRKSYSRFIACLHSLQSAFQATSNLIEEVQAGPSVESDDGSK